MTDDSGEDGDDDEEEGELPTANHDASEDTDKEMEGGNRVDQNAPDIIASVSDADELLRGGEGMAVSQEILGRLSKAARAEIALVIVASSRQHQEKKRNRIETETDDPPSKKKRSTSTTPRLDISR